MVNKMTYPNNLSDSEISELKYYNNLMNLIFILRKYENKELKRAHSKLVTIEQKLEEIELNSTYSSKYSEKIKEAGELLTKVKIETEINKRR